MVDLSVKIAGIKFKNPVFPAAGPPGKDGETLVAAAKGGAGGLVAKTVSVKAADVPRPNMMVMDRGNISVYRYAVAGKTLQKMVHTYIKAGHGFLNTELWTDLSPEQWLEHEYKIAKTAGLPLIASIGYTSEELAHLGPLVQAAGADAIEFSTHYVDPRGLEKTVIALKNVVKIPVFAKLSPHDPETLIAQAKIAEAAGVDGIVAINSFGPTLHIDIETARPMLGSKLGFGWMSGSPLKPLAVRCVFDIARSVKVPVMGVGGIMSGRDAIEFFMVGASAVQICTGAILEGPTIYKRITKEIIEFMEAHGYNKIDDLKGLYIKNIGQGQEIITKGGYSETNSQICKGCHICYKSCVYDAISYIKTEIGKEVSFIDKNKCHACGLCTTVCPTKAISLKELQVNT